MAIFRLLLSQPRGLNILFVALTSPRLWALAGRASRTKDPVVIMAGALRHRRLARAIAGALADRVLTLGVVSTLPVTAADALVVQAVLRDPSCVAAIQSGLRTSSARESVAAAIAGDPAWAIGDPTVRRAVFAVLAVPAVRSLVRRELPERIPAELRQYGPVIVAGVDLLDVAAFRVALEAALAESHAQNLIVSVIRKESSGAALVMALDAVAVRDAVAQAIEAPSMRAALGAAAGDGFLANRVRAILAHGPTRAALRSKLEDHTFRQRVYRAADGRRASIVRVALTVAKVYYLE